MNDEFAMHIDTRIPEDRDDTPVVISRGLLRQLIRGVLKSRGVNGNVDFAFVPEHSHITGVVMFEDRVEFTLANGDALDVDIWPEVVQ